VKYVDESLEVHVDGKALKDYSTSLIVKTFTLSFKDTEKERSLKYIQSYAIL